MTNYFFDTYAIIELIKGNIKYEHLKDFPIITSIMNLAETYYALLLSNGKETADTIVASLDLNFLEITPEIVLDAALFRFQNKKQELSYIDSLGYILALKNNLLFLTGDKQFKYLESVEFISK
jgi:uncharacterized protein